MSLAVLLSLSNKFMSPGGGLGQSLRSLGGFLSYSMYHFCSQVLFL